MAIGSTGYLAQIDYTARDYAAIRTALLKHVQNFFPNDWQDFTESNLGVCILELVAYVGDNLSFYLDRVVNELFLPTVVQRANAINIVSLLGYVPRTVSAASAPIQMTLSPAQASTVTVPAWTFFSDEGGEIWEFLESIEIPAGRTDTTSITVTGEVLTTIVSTILPYSLQTNFDNLIVGTADLHLTIGSVTYSITVADDGTVTLPFGGTGILDWDTGALALTFVIGYNPDVASTITLDYEWNQRITAYHGRTRLEQFLSDGTTDQEFTLLQTPVLFSSRAEEDPVSPNSNRFEVWLGDPDDPFGNGTGTLYRRVNNLVLSSGLEEVYELSVDDQDRVIIRFGDNLNGKVPPAGTLNIIYRVGGGTKGNISSGYIDTTVTGSIGLFSVSVFSTNYEPGLGGAERESLDEIRVNAPAYFRTNDTATTEQDYDSLAIYSRSGLGSVARAKARLTPEETVTTKTIHTNYVMGEVPIGVPLEYYLLFPAVPVILNTVNFYYTVAGVVRSATATSVGGGLANLTGDATIDAGNTRFRYAVQEIDDEVPASFLGNGVLINFSDTLGSNPIMPSSVVFRYNIAGTDYVGYDNPTLDPGTGGCIGTGTLLGVHILDGTINYKTGAVVLHFGTHATLTSVAGPFNLNALGAGADVFLGVHVDGAAQQDVRFQAGDFFNYASCSAVEVAAVLNTGGMTGVGNKLAGTTSTAISGNKVQILSNTWGIVVSKLDVDAPGAGVNANTALGYPTALVTGISYPPTNTSLIYLDYQSCLHLTLNFAPDSGTEFTVSMESGPSDKTFPTNNIEVYAWAQDSSLNFVPPSDSLKDSLKAFLDLRRVLGTSVQILSGKNLQIHYKFNVDFTANTDYTATSAAVATALETYFMDVVTVNAGALVPLAAIYDTLYPLSGIASIIAQEVGIRLPIGEGNANKAIFKDDPTYKHPGQYIDTTRLPMVTTAGTIKVFVDGYEAGSSNGTTDPSGNQVIVASGSGVYATIGGTYVHATTGVFEVKISPAPSRGSVVYLEFYLDEVAAVDQMQIWNFQADEWEMVILGEVYVNSIKVN